MSNGCSDATTVALATVVSRKATKNSMMSNASENPPQNEILIEARRSGVRFAQRNSATKPV